MDEKSRTESKISIEQRSLPPEPLPNGICSAADSEAEERRIMERKLIRKLDTRLLPTVVIIYVMNYIDRNNITAARLKGLQSDLGLADVQYDTVLAMLYVTYIISQVPSNMLLNYVSRPSIYIGACVVLWGLDSALTGVTTNYTGALICRLFLGLPEAAFYPGIVYLLSRWYTKKELSIRTAILLSGVMIANAFGNLIAAGILSQMEGKLGIRAWRWLFYIEGSITMAFGFLAMWLLPDYPNNTRWLSASERRLAQMRMAEDAGEADKDDLEDSLLQGLRMALKDPLVYLFVLATVFQSLGMSFQIFFPTITKTLGFSTTETLLIAAPPWLFATLICYLNAWHADRTGERFLHIAIWFFSVIIGYVIALSSMSTAVRYISLFCMTCGYCGIALNLVWLSNVVTRPPAKRAAAIGLVNGIGNVGSLIGTYVWKAKWGPGYHPSMIITLISTFLSIFLLFVIRQMLIRKNQRLSADENALLEVDQARIEAAAVLQGITFEEGLKRRQGFRYLY